MLQVHLGVVQRRLTLFDLRQRGHELGFGHADRGPARPDQRFLRLDLGIGALKLGLGPVIGRLELVDLAGGDDAALVQLLGPVQVELGVLEPDRRVPALRPDRGEPRLGVG